MQNKDYLKTSEVVTLVKQAMKDDPDCDLKPFGNNDESNRRRMEDWLKKGKVATKYNSKRPLLWEKEDVELYFLKRGLDLQLDTNYQEWFNDLLKEDQKTNEEVYNSNDDNVPKISRDTYINVELRLLLKLISANLGRNFDEKALQDDLGLVFASNNRDFENFRALRSLEKLDINRYFPKKDKK